MTSQRIVRGPGAATLMDVLDRILDEGLIVAGDFKIKLLDAGLLTIQVRLVVCSVDQATEMRMDFAGAAPARRRAGQHERARVARAQGGRAGGGGKAGGRSPPRGDVRRYGRRSLIRLDPRRRARARVRVRGVRVRVAFLPSSRWSYRRWPGG